MNLTIKIGNIGEIQVSELLNGIVALLKALVGVLGDALWGIGKEFNMYPERGLLILSTIAIAMVLIESAHRGGVYDATPNGGAPSRWQQRAINVALLLLGVLLLVQLHQEQRGVAVLLTALWVALAAFRANWRGLHQTQPPVGPGTQAREVVNSFILAISFVCLAVLLIASLGL